MTSEELLALSDEELDRIPLDDIKAVLERERRVLDRLSRRRAELLAAHAEDVRPKTLTEIGRLLALTPERVGQIEKIALLKLRRQFPTVRHLLERTSE